MTPARKLSTTTSDTRTRSSDHFAALLRLGVELDRAFVSIERCKDHVVHVCFGRIAVKVARQVAGAGPLDLNDVGTKVGQHLRGTRAHHDLGKVENSDSA